MTKFGSLMTLLRIATLPLLFNSCLAFSQEAFLQLPAAARSEVEQHCSSMKDAAQVALGDLNGDRIDDIAAMGSCNEKGSDRKIVVLMGTADGRFVFYVKSASWEPHMLRNEYFGIKQQSIELTASSTSSMSYSGTLYKFVLRDGVFILAGLDYTAGRFGDNGGHKISANFLTKKLVSRRINNKGGTRQESHRVLKADYRVPLSRFSLEDEDTVDALSLR